MWTVLASDRFVATARMECERYPTMTAMEWTSHACFTAIFSRAKGTGGELNDGMDTLQTVYVRVKHPTTQGGGGG